LVYGDVVAILLVEKGTRSARSASPPRRRRIGHPDTTAQAQRLGNVLKDAGIPVTMFGAKETTHDIVNADLGKPDDPATKAQFEFLGQALKK
jgi:hypothetical protein